MAGSSASKAPAKRRRSPPTKHWHGGSQVAWIALAATLIGNIVTIGYVYGVISTRLTHAEGAVIELKAESKALSTLKEDMAAAKTHLTNINSTLERLERNLRPGQK